MTETAVETASAAVPTSIPHWIAGRRQEGAHRLDHQHGEVAAGAAAEGQRLHRILDAALMPWDVGQFPLDAVGHGFQLALQAKNGTVVDLGHGAPFLKNGSSHCPGQVSL